MKPIECLAELLTSLEIEACCVDLMDDDDEADVCANTCEKYCTECWIRWAKMKADTNDGECIPVDYIRERIKETCGAESAYLKKLVSKWEGEKDDRKTT